RLGSIEFADRQVDERSAELHGDPRIGGEIAEADDAADRALAANQHGLDVAAVFIGNEIGRKARATGKVDSVDVITGIIKQFVRSRLIRREMWRDQREIRLAQPSQQIVVRPVAAAPGTSL